MSQTEHNNLSFENTIRSMVVEDEPSEKQKEIMKGAPVSSKWRKITLACYAVLPVLILAICMTRLKLMDFSLGEIGFPKLIFHILMLTYLLVFQIWVVCKYGDILFPRLLHLWERVKGKMRHAFAK